MGERVCYHHGLALVTEAQNLNGLPNVCSIQVVDFFLYIQSFLSLNYYWFEIKCF